MTSTKTVLAFIWYFILLLGATAGVIRFFNAGGWYYALSVFFALLGLYNVRKIHKLIGE